MAAQESRQVRAGVYSIRQRGEKAVSRQSSRQEVRGMEQYTAAGRHGRQEAGSRQRGAMLYEAIYTGGIYI